MDDYKSDYKLSMKRKALLISISIVLTTIVAIYSICVSKYTISFSESIQIIVNNLNNIDPVNYVERLKNYIVWDGTVPRAIAGVSVGAVLAVGGAVMQTIIRNPLTDSYTTGISSGALFGVTIFLVLGISIIPGITGDMGMIINAFVFALIPSAIIILFSVFKNVTPTVMVLIGIAVMYIFSATTTLLKYTCTDEDLSTIYEWSVGTLGRVDWSSIPYLLIGCTCILVVMALMSKSLNALTSSDNYAKTLGVDPSKIRIISLLVISVTTAIVVCFTGTIGFVGLVSPHIARMMAGSNTKYLIPSSAVIGAFMLISADCLARMVGPTGLPVGVITALIGGPVFLLLLLKQRKGSWQ